VPALRERPIMTTTATRSNRNPVPAAFDVRYRVANSGDVAGIVALVEAAGLPAREIEAFIDTFVVAERHGRLIGCGGLEVHDDTAVVRSVAVAAEARGLGVGRRLFLRLSALARAFWVADLYLFTGDAAPFWQKLGFRDVRLDEWREPARLCWQYGYVSEHREWAERAGLRTMWMLAMT
jgi:amino-acid N-acetyltransferase